MRAAMECVSEGDVLGFVRGTLDVAHRSTIEAHLDRCAECLELVTLAGKTSLVVAEPAAAPTRDALRAIERYEIGEQIGHGAMGTVYAARDTRLGRRVAIKLVHPRLAGDERSQIGLLREAQALARIAQPNVLTVYDVGVVDNAVFLAAELVEGGTLEAWLRRPRGCRAIAMVFVQAARGLDAAHSAGLVHRDFKPSNVLIGHDGRVRVFDFGLARFTETLVAGELAGTPLYMSPEQRRGDVADARSDQYAFCVALHEAIHGHHPILADRQIARGDAAAPRWLRDVIARGLQVDPVRRFPAMRDVIACLERGLARRSRVLIAGSAIIAVAIAGGVARVAYTHGTEAPDAACPRVLPDTWAAARKDQLAAVFAQTKLPYAAQAAARVTGELDAFAARWGAAQQDACLARRADRELHARRKTCLEQQRFVFDAIVERFLEADTKLVDRAHVLLAALPDVDACARPTGPAWPGDPASAAQFAAHFREVARVASLAEAGKLEDAETRARTLADAAKQLRFRRAEADALYLRGHVAGMKGRFEEAVKDVDAALWIGGEIRYDELVVMATNELIYLVATRQKRPADARQFVKLARSAAERMATISARARTAHSIGNLELMAGHFDLAQQELERAVALNTGGDPLLTAAVMMDLSNLASQRGRAVAAEVLLRYAISVYRRELGELHPRHAQMLNNLGNTLLDLRRPDEAAAAFDQAIAIFERTLGPEHPDVGQLLGNAVGVQIVRGDLVRARAMLERAVAILEKTGAPPVFATTVFNLAQLNRIEGKDQEAERLFLRALGLRATALGEHHPQVTEALLAAAGMALARRDLAATRTFCDRAARSIAGSDVNNQAWQGSIETCLGELELVAKRPARAVPLLEAALARHEAAHDLGRRAYTAFALARALPRRDRPRAIELAQSARAAFAPEGATFKPEVDAIDRWLANSAR
jgi:eukaryotic-like serine/threonine-protein kinase